MGGTGSGQLTKLINQLLFNTTLRRWPKFCRWRSSWDLTRIKSAGCHTGTGRSFAAEFFIPQILDNRFDQGYASSTRTRT